MTAHDGIFSSSPLKTATSFSGPSVSSFSGAVNTYLSKYCDVVTGGRVICYGFYSNRNWVKFKCNVCQDNWNVKTDLFSNAGSCPTELQDWLVQHKHVCHKFTSIGQGVVSDPKCIGCGWGLNRHAISDVPLSELKKETPFVSPEGVISPPVYHKLSPGEIITLHPGEKIVPLYDVFLDGKSTVRSCSVCDETIPVNVSNGSSICDECYKAAKAMRSKTQVKPTPIQGRMFRTKETRCELQKATEGTNSPDSVN